MRARHIPGSPRLLDADVDFIGQAVKLHRQIRGRRKVAQSYVFVWLLILAELENTIPSDVLDRLRRVAPTRGDQARLLVQLRAALREKPDDA